MESSGTTEPDPILPSTYSVASDILNDVNYAPQTVTFAPFHNDVNFNQPVIVETDDLFFNIPSDPPIAQTKSDLQIELLRLQIKSVKREMYLRELKIIELENSLNISEQQKQNIVDKCFAP